jgi:hypothetical protein
MMMIRDLLSPNLTVTYHGKRVYTDNTHPSRGSDSLDFGVRHFPVTLYPEGPEALSALSLRGLARGLRAQRDGPRQRVLSRLRARSTPGACLITTGRMQRLSNCNGQTWMNGSSFLRKCVIAACSVQITALHAALHAVIIVMKFFEEMCDLNDEVF